MHLPFSRFPKILETLRLTESDTESDAQHAIYIGGLKKNELSLLVQTNKLSSQDNTKWVQL